ncbi:hypothetical protein Tdes44962_MAKER01439, partial [Teratosphaeria destructans]
GHLNNFQLRPCEEFLTLNQSPTETSARTSITVTMASVRDSYKLIAAAMNWDGGKEPLLLLADLSSAYATATGRLTESGKGTTCMFTMWNGNTILRAQDQRGGDPLSLRRAEVTRISYSESSPLIMVSAQSSRICDGQLRAHNELVRQFNVLASKLPEDKFKIFVAEACKEIRVRKAELELAVLRGS